MKAKTITVFGQIVVTDVLGALKDYFKNDSNFGGALVKTKVEFGWDDTIQLVALIEDIEVARKIIEVPKALSEKRFKELLENILIELTEAEKAQEKVIQIKR